MEFELFKLTINLTKKGYYWCLEKKIKRRILGGFFLRFFAGSSRDEGYYASDEEARLEAMEFLKRYHYQSTVDVEVIIHEKDGFKTPYAHSAPQ